MKVEQLQNSSSLSEDNGSENKHKLKVLHTLYLMKKSYPLYFCMLGTFLILFGIMYLVVKPTFMATATIGAPAPSPATSMLGSSSSALGRAASIFGSGSQSTNPFKEYLQTIYSARLAHELVEKDHLLQIIFKKNWDAEHKRWRKPSWLHNVKNAVKRVMHRPVYDHPNEKSLRKALSKAIKVKAAQSFSSSALATSNFYNVSLTGKTPQGAERLLKLILERSDEIIRQEQLSNVNARVKSLEAELPKITASEQREALIRTLSAQQELQTMLISDKYYAITMVDPPSAPLSPVKPLPPKMAVILSIILSFIIFFALAFFEDQFLFSHKLLNKFRRENFKFSSHR